MGFTVARFAIRVRLMLAEGSRKCGLVALLSAPHLSVEEGYFFGSSSNASCPNIATSYLIASKLAELAARSTSAIMLS